MNAGTHHRLAAKVAVAARLANSPIGYYNAHADITVLLGDGVTDLDGFFRGMYGESWDRAERKITDAVTAMHAGEES